jgi:hypothetical protein
MSLRLPGLMGRRVEAPVHTLRSVRSVHLSQVEHGQRRRLHRTTRHDTMRRLRTRVAIISTDSMPRKW